MCVDLHDRGLIVTWIMYYLPLLGGERMLTREHFLAIPEKFLQGYRVETALNAYFRIHHLSIKAQKLNDLRIRRKMQKMGFWAGLYGYIKMTIEMLHAAWLTRIAGVRGKL